MSGQPQSWRDCALLAKYLLDHASVHPSLEPHVHSFRRAVDALERSEAPVVAAPVVPAPVVAAPSPAFRLISWGANERGTLGQGYQRPPNWETARPLIVPDGVNFVVALAGDDFSGFVTRDGALYLAGSNSTYLHGDTNGRGRETAAPIALLAGRRVSCAFAGGTASHLFAIVDGKLYAWGRLSVALGLDKRSITVEPTPVERLGTRSFPGGVPEAELRTVALGAAHSLVLTSRGAPFTGGSNARGQLGIGAPNNPYDCHTFEPPEGIDGVRFVAAACGEMHSALVSEAGELYTAGRGSAGELGLGDTSDRFRFTRVTRGSIAGKRIVQVACGSEATYCVSDDGRLHASGSNAKGQLGRGDEGQQTQFVEVPLAVAVTQVTAGLHHVLALGADGSLIGWGENQFAQVTPGEKDRPLKTPTVLEHFAAQRVLAVAAGKAHTVAVVAG